MELFDYSFPKQQNLNFSNLKEFADYNFKFDVNGWKVSKLVENTGKRRNCSLWAISPFPTVFLKDLYNRQVKTRACLGKVYRVIAKGQQKSRQSDSL